MTKRLPSLFASLVSLLAAPVLIAAAAHADGETKAPDASPVAKVGQTAPAFTLTDASGTTHKLADYRGKLVVLQWFNPDCPVCKRVTSSGKVAAMRKELDAIGTPWVHLAINSTHYMDSAKSAAYLTEYKLKIPALIDQNGEVGHLYQAKTTPHMFVIDAKGVLRYSGAINDDARGTKGDDATNYVVNAVRQLAAGETVAPDTTRPFGCSVKYDPAGGKNKGKGKGKGDARGGRGQGGDRANRGGRGQGGDRANRGGNDRRAEMLKRFDTDGDGKLSETERTVARETMKAEMLKKYDKDGDGELSESERETMRKAEGRGRGGSGRGGSGRGGNGKTDRP